jgi:hypothetical protein
MQFLLTWWIVGAGGRLIPNLSRHVREVSWLCGSLGILEGRLLKMLELVVLGMAHSGWVLCTSGLGLGFGLRSNEQRFA